MTFRSLSQSLDKNLCSPCHRPSTVPGDDLEVSSSTLRNLHIRGPKRVERHVCPRVPLFQVSRLLESPCPLGYQFKKLSFIPNIGPGFSQCIGILWWTEQAYIPPSHFLLQLITSAGLFISFFSSLIFPSLHPHLSKYGSEYSCKKKKCMIIINRCRNDIWQNFILIHDFKKFSGN